MSATVRKRQKTRTKLLLHGRGLYHTGRILFFTTAEKKFLKIAAALFRISWMTNSFGTHQVNFFFPPFLPGSTCTYLHLLSVCVMGSFTSYNKQLTGSSRFYYDWVQQHCLPLVLFLLNKQNTLIINNIKHNSPRGSKQWHEKFLEPYNLEDGEVVTRFE